MTGAVGGLGCSLVWILGRDVTTNIIMTPMMMMTMMNGGGAAYGLHCDLERV